MSHPSGRRAGLRDGTAVVVGYFPFALAIGAALSSAGVDPFIAWLSSPVMITGAAQLVQWRCSASAPLRCAPSSW